MRSKLLIAILAVFATAVVAATSAVAGAMITSAQIKNETIQSVDVKNGSLGVVDLSTAARTALRGATGATGATGAAGAPGTAGAKGATGAPGPSTSSSYFAVGPVDHGVAETYEVACPAGKKATGGGAFAYYSTDNDKIAVLQQYSNSVDDGDVPTKWTAVIKNIDPAIDDVQVGVEVVYTP